MQLALERMAVLLAQVVSREMVFEWLRQAGTDIFRAISRELCWRARPRYWAIF